MSSVILRYEVLISGIYPFEGEYTKNGFTIATNKVDTNKTDSIFGMGVLYISPYLGSCCYMDENKTPVYLTFIKEESINIDYGKNKEYDRAYTTQFLQNEGFMNKIDELEKNMTIETNNFIRFPARMIKAYDPEENTIATLCNFEKINVPSLIQLDREIVSEVRKRQQNRLGNYISYENIIKLRENNAFFDNAISAYFASFLVNDEKFGFVLLVTALESLLSLSTYSKSEKCKECGQNKYKIRSTIAENVSLILMDKDESIKKEIKKLYDKRSKFVHEGKKDIAKADEQKMQEYVRKVLLAYWNISLYKNTYEHKLIIEEIHSGRYSQNLACQTFLTALSNEKFEDIYEKAMEQVYNSLSNGKIKLQ